MNESKLDQPWFKEGGFYFAAMVELKVADRIFYLFLIIVAVKDAVKFRFIFQKNINNL